MSCTHLKQLIQLCEANDLKLASSDLIHIVCKECGETEVCPSVLMSRYDQDDESQTADQSAPGEKSSGGE